MPTVALLVSTLAFLAVCSATVLVLMGIGTNGFQNCSTTTVVVAFGCFITAMLSVASIVGLLFFSNLST